MAVPHRQIRARYTAETVTVYQAYGPEIALRAVEAGRFVAPFKRDRMTWVKPSFMWMMYRSGWAAKAGQEHVLAIDITRTGFEWALARADSRIGPVRVQWDPERSLRLSPLPYRSLQLGLSGEAVDRYVDDWTVAITDITPTVHRIHDLVQAGDETDAETLLPVERPYPLPPAIASVLGATWPPTV